SRHRSQGGLLPAAGEPGRSGADRSDEPFHLTDRPLIALAPRRPVEALLAPDAESLQIAAHGGLGPPETHVAQRAPDVELALHGLLLQQLDDRLATVVLMLAVDRHGASPGSAPMTDLSASLPCARPFVKLSIDSLAQIEQLMRDRARWL